ncbi:hypothetical protein [Bradyrhizobium sp. 930_D9_N1_4]|uniref:hypothetical protein n=1 Tax=Bradyrhizobium sp. 930_D9_N1_4 TaxID=3240374 RepID=UPI003F8CE6EF
MTKIDIEQLTSIPFLDHGELSGRFLCSTMFYDGEWHAWIDAGGRLFKTQMWPAETVYFGTRAEKPTDVCLHFLNLMAQRLNCYPISRQLFALQDDVYNVAASLAKIQHLHRSRKEFENGVTRLVATELEYVHSVCRSVFDLWQEVLVAIWSNIRLLDPAVKKRQLKKSYADMLFSANKPRTAQELTDRFGIPGPLAECYTRSTDFFADLRQFRDRVVHHGGGPQTIFDSDDGFLMVASRMPFRGPTLWRPDEFRPNDLVPLLPVVNFAIYRTIAICGEFSETLEQIFQLQPPTVPKFHLYLRGYFDAALMRAFEDVEARL